MPRLIRNHTRSFYIFFLHISLGICILCFFLCVQCKIFFNDSVCGTGTLWIFSYAGMRDLMIAAVLLPTYRTSQMFLMYMRDGVFWRILFSAYLLHSTHQGAYYEPFSLRLIMECCMQISICCVFAVYYKCKFTIVARGTQPIHQRTSSISVS